MIARASASVWCTCSFAVLLAGGIGCKKSSDEDAYAPPPELAKWLPTATATATAAKPGPGPAYLSIQNQGIAIIDQSGSRLVIRLEHDTLAMALTDAGELLFTTFDGVFALRDGAAVLLADDDTIGLTLLETAEDVRMDPKGRLWVIGSKGTISIRDGETWTAHLQEETGLDLQFKYSEMLFDTEGRSWLAADDALYRQTGDEPKWEPVDVDLIAHESFMRNFEQVAMVDDGTVLTGLSSGLFAYTQGTWKQVELADGYSDADLLAANGSTIVTMVGSALHRIGPEGATRIAAGKDTWVASRVFDLELDGAGRAWIATDNGLVVVSPDGTVTQWTPGTLPGVLGRIEDIVVAGAGPATLPTPVVPIKGSVQTGLVKKGVPLAGATIEMCEGPKQIFTKTPCESAVWRWSADTGSNGLVRFTDVPVGNYGLTFKIGNDWHAYFNPIKPFECCTQLTEGEVLDVGVFEIGD